MKSRTELFKELRINSFKKVLLEIKENDNNYKKRYGLVYEALYKALRLGYNAGVRIDPEEKEWPVVYIELPTGQVSWHVPQHDNEWDKHSTEDKYKRIAEYAESE